MYHTTLFKKNRDQTISSVRHDNLCYSHFYLVHCLKPTELDEGLSNFTIEYPNCAGSSNYYSVANAHLDSPRKRIDVNLITKDVATNRSWTLLPMPTPLACWSEPSSPLQLAGRAYQRPCFGSTWSQLSLPRPDAIDWCLGSTRSPMSTDRCRHQPGTSLTIVAQVIALKRSLYRHSLICMAFADSSNSQGYERWQVSTDFIVDWVLERIYKSPF